jgi:DNA-binding CsgD family transcriptional regulator
MRFRPPAAWIGAPGGGRLPSSVVASLHMSELVERDAELAAITDVVERAASGAGGALLVEGAAGVGKTRLLQFAAQLADGPRLRVLEARGGELEQSFPFGVAAQLLGPAVAAMGGPQRAAILSGAAGHAVDVIDPRATAELTSARSHEALYARLLGLYWLCAGLSAEKPLLLVVDDAHWADEPSLQWLLFMSRRLGDMPITLVLGARVAAAGAWPGPLALLSDEAHVSRLRPRPFTEHGCRIVLERLLGAEADEEFTVACHQASGGNPFLISELVAALRAEGLTPTAAAAPRIRSLAPEGLARSVLARLGRMPPATAALARAVAVLGVEVELRHAAALAELELAAAGAAADALATAGLLDPGRPLRLVHPVVRTALYSELPAGDRAELHARAARMLEQEDGDLDAIAAHLLAAEPSGARRTVELLLEAAERAVIRGSPPTAATYLRRALGEPPPQELRGAVLRRLGIVETRLGDPSAAEHVSQALRVTREPHRRAELAYEASVGYLVAGRLAEAIGTLEDGVRDIEEGDRELGWRLEAQLINVAGLDSAYRDVAARHLERVPRDLPGDTPGERLILAELAWAALKSADPVGRVVDLAERAFADGRLTVEQPGWSLSVLNGIWALALAERRAAAMRAYDELIAVAQRNGSPIMFALVSSRRSQLHYLEGAIPDAIADARASIDAGRTFAPGLVGGLYGRLIDALLEAGDLQAAEEALGSSGFDEAIPAGWQFLPLLQSRGRLRITTGDVQAGIDDLLAAQQVLDRCGISNPAVAPCRSTAAVALARTGLGEQAQELLAGELSAARRFGAPSALGIALRAAGVIAGGSTGIELLREAIVQLERSSARLEHARALAELGAALRRSGRRRDAQGPLRRALDLADRCGGKVVADHARAELVITGARPRRARIEGVEALTPSERRVAQLAAQGMTNREIAQALFVSHPTVVTHLGHCYQKLNITSRGELPAALTERGAGDSVAT